jgi:hypothetical protein
MPSQGELPHDTKPDQLAVVLLVAVQGGLLVT